MEELYKKYNRSNTKKVNTVIDKNLTFHFSRHVIRTKFLVFPVIILIFSLYVQTLEYLWVETFFIIYLIINKLLTYKVKFDDNNIIISNIFITKSIYYSQGINVFIEEKIDGEICGVDRPDKLNKSIFKESNNRYNLVISYEDELEYIVLVSTYSASSIVAESTKNEIERFIENFTFDENNIPKKEDNSYIRLKNIQI